MERERTGMRDVFEIASALSTMLVSWLAPLLIVVWDERRLPPDALERAWPPATRLTAPFAWGPLCLPVHYWRTRRTLRGTLLGFAAMALVIALIVGFSAALDALEGALVIASPT